MYELERFGLNRIEQKIKVSPDAKSRFLCRPICGLNTQNLEKMYKINFKVRTFLNLGLICKSQEHYTLYKNPRNFFPFFPLIWRGLPKKMTHFVAKKSKFRKML